MFLANLRDVFATTLISQWKSRSPGIQVLDHRGMQRALLSTILRRPSGPFATHIPRRCVLSLRPSNPSANAVRFFTAKTLSLQAAESVTRNPENEIVSDEVSQRADDDLASKNDVLLKLETPSMRRASRLARKQRRIEAGAHPRTPQQLGEKVQASTESPVTLSGVDSDPIELETQSLGTEQLMESKKDVASKRRNKPKGHAQRAYLDSPNDAYTLDIDSSNQLSMKRQKRRTRTTPPHSSIQSEPTEGAVATSETEYTPERLYKSNQSGKDHENGQEAADSEAQSDRPEWSIRKRTLKERSNGEQWRPTKRLSPETIEGIRALVEAYPDRVNLKMLSKQFGISFEAMRRIVKSKSWRPTQEQTDERMQRWERRGAKIWTKLAREGVKPPKQWRDLGVGKLDPDQPVPDWKQEEWWESNVEKFLHEAKDVESDQKRQDHDKVS
jgi:hypothetical protein